MSVISIPCPACGQALKIRDRNLLGRKGKCPKCSHSFVLEEPTGAALQLAASSAQGAATAWTPNASAPLQEPQAHGSPIPETAATIPIAPTAVEPYRRRRKNSRRGWVNAFVGLMILAIVGGGGYYMYTAAPPPTKKGAGGKHASKPGTGHSGQAVSEEEQDLAASPTEGKPISLELVPAGARTIVHFRPADLWVADSRGEEFRFCLGPLGEFVDAQIKALCKRPPADIEELIFAWIPGQRGTPPDMAVVVRLKNDAKKSELLDLVGGQVDESHGHAVYIDGERAGVIANLKTFAFAPATMAADLANSVTQSNPQPTGIEALLEKTDRQRHLTILFEPTALLLDGESMVPTNALPFLTQAMDWFGDDAETVAWSAHLEDDRFYSEISVRNLTTVSTSTLEERLRSRVEALPKELADAFRAMQPREQGRRQIIGRFPAMMKIAAMATQTDRGTRLVRLITPMPDRAAPNLALGSLFAWDESTRTDFNRKPVAPPMSTEPTNLPATIAERLQKKVDIDFRRTPLQEAFAFVAEETFVTIDIDGDALKLAGYTQNMPQTFKLDQVPATEALANILKNYDKMCIVVDEAKKMAIVMTYPVAEQRGLKPFPIEIK